MPVSQQGAINTTALIVPDVYVQIVPPQITLLNGLPTNILGVVGTAAWGPVNAPVTIGNMSDYAHLFGPIQARKYDMGTAIAAAVIQGANNFRCVRVTDGTDTAASTALLDTATTPATGLTVTSKYTGSLGDSIQVTLDAGTQPSTYKISVAMPGRVTETFDNIGGTGNALWVSMADAVNLGQSGLRGPSEIVVAAATASVDAPALVTQTLAGGADGAAAITGATLVGSDITPRSGMYALRGALASIAMLTDCDDATTWSLQAAFGLSEGVYMVAAGPAGDTISNAVAAKSTAGIDSYAMKLLFGDWCYFNDTVNGQIRLISPQGFAAGRLANLSPEQSSLNKPLYGIVGTEKSSQNLTYSTAELGQLAQAGIDVIANPAPYGNVYAVRIGHNTSSNAVTNGDNYTRMTNYIAYTLNSGMGKFIGQLQSETVRRNAAATISSFLANMEQQGMIGSVNGGSAYSVQIDAANNPMSRVALGYLQADVKVIYLSVIEKFLINVEGGQSVQISRQSTQTQ